MKAALGQRGSGPVTLFEAALLCEDDLETLHEQFSLEVLDQFCDIVGDSEVKAEEIKQREIFPVPTLLLRSLQTRYSPPAW